MAANSSIEWTEVTWNPVTGCTKISPGCTRCYAMPLSHRLAAMGQKKYEGTTAKIRDKTHWTGKLVLDEPALELPSHWLKSRTIFVNSMSDLFHDQVPFSFILRVFKAMQQAPQHRYQVLTKRSDRLLGVNHVLPWTSQIWMGVSVESRDYMFRIDHLRRTGAAVKFLSLEPLLSPLDGLDLEGISWVIVGGESGPGARPMQSEWVIGIRKQCEAAGVPFFFKQWGHLRNNPDQDDPTAKQNGGTAKGGRLLEGRAWDQMPQMRGDGR